MSTFLSGLAAAVIAGLLGAAGTLGVKLAKKLPDSLLRRILLWDGTFKKRSSQR